MAEQTQTVESQTTGQTPTTDKQSIEQKPDANAQANGEQTQTGAAGRVEELPDWAQRELKEARQEAQRYRNERKAAEDAAKRAEEERMVQSAEWQQLAETRGKELQDAKSKAGDYDKLAELVGKQLQTEIDAWDEKVKNLFPADKEMPVLEMLEWAERFRPLALEMAEDKAPTPGNHRRPQPISPANAAKANENQRNQWAQRAKQRYR